MDEEFLLDALRWMLLSRLYDEKVIGLQRQGRFGVYSPGLGQEASIVGSSMALDPERDWIVPQYRELMAIVRHGYPLEKITATYMGKTTEATRIPEGVNVLPTQVALAAQLPQAVGLAWGLKLQGKDAVVMAYIGDGGSSEGDFHEALNLAGVQKVPIVFFMQNNQWAISTPRSLQSATPSFSLRAAGYGFPGVEVDGNDIFAVYQAAVEAVRRARAGDGPTLIESVTYRMGFHNTTDNPSRYEDKEQRADFERRDPIDRVVRYLRSLGLLDEQREDNLRAEVSAEVDRVIEAAAAEPGVRPDGMFDNVYERPPARVLKQREQFRGSNGNA
ncbi:MAG: thiamine pyrophosphate-dependent dehydrogenase E1 component subunit alpha [Chloroflexi bacterium]|nr:MAG: thiamine pyrophosphate-dependent dehydrogenase E1 component subunit alpha [Chloroflexota bacterium]